LVNLDRWRKYIFNKRLSLEFLDKFEAYFESELQKLKEKDKINHESFIETEAFGVVERFRNVLSDVIKVKKEMKKCEKRKKI